VGREQILRRLKAPAWASPVLPSRMVDFGGPKPGRVDLFIAKASAAGAQVVQLADLNAARAYIEGLIKENNVTQVIGSVDPATQGLNLAELAAGAGFTFFHSGQLAGKEYRDYVYNCQLGITGCGYGLEETGALVLRHSRNNERLLSLAPDHYIGIIFSDQILADRYSLAAIIQEDANPPAAWTLITGVSRTADIIMTTILGMHGPRRVTVIVIAEQEK